MHQHHKNSNLSISYRAGLFAVIMTGLTQDYFAPFLLLIGGTALHVGILNGLNNLFSSLVQLPSADLTKKYNSRKKIVLFFVFLQIITLIILSILALRSYIHPFIFIGIVACFTAFGAITHPGWVSLLSDMVVSDRRGEYFGWRARNLGFIAIIAAFIAGCVLFGFNRLNLFIGFFLIFSLAGVSRLLSFKYMNEMQEPPLNYQQSQSFSLWKFLKQTKQSNFAQFVFFVAGVNFCVNLAAPFFVVFMLENLQFNYILYTLINIIAPIVLYATISRWGRHADHIGNLKVLKVVAPLFGLIPILWIINQSPVFLIFAEMVSGFLWAGFNLCSSNFIIDAVTPEKRTRCIAYFSVINGLALALGAFVGGQLLHFLPPLKGHKILTLLLISSICRVIIGIIMPRKLKEVRPVERVTSQELLFSMIGVKPIAGIERKSIQL